MQFHENILPWLNKLIIIYYDKYNVYDFPENPYANKKSIFQRLNLLWKCIVNYSEKIRACKQNCARREIPIVQTNIPLILFKFQLYVWRCGCISKHKQCRRSHVLYGCNAQMNGEQLNVWNMSCMWNEVHKHTIISSKNFLCL